MIVVTKSYVTVNLSHSFRGLFLCLCTVVFVLLCCPYNSHLNWQPCTFVNTYWIELNRILFLRYTCLCAHHKVEWGSGGETPLFINFSIVFTPQLTYLWERVTSIHWMGPWVSLDSLVKRTPFLGLPEIETLFLGCPAHNPVTIPITLSRIFRHHPHHHHHHHHYLHGS